MTQIKPFACPSIGDYVKVINTTSPFYGLIGKVEQVVFPGHSWFVRLSDKNTSLIPLQRFEKSELVVTNSEEQYINNLYRRYNRVRAETFKDILTVLECCDSIYEARMLISTHLKTLVKKSYPDNVAEKVINELSNKHQGNIITR